MRRFAGAAPCDLWELQRSQVPACGRYDPYFTGPYRVNGEKIALLVGLHAVVSRLDKQLCG
jgi:hypothetical protein